MWLQRQTINNSTFKDDQEIGEQQLASGRISTIKIMAEAQSQLFYKIMYLYVYKAANGCPMSISVFIDFIPANSHLVLNHFLNP